MLTFTHHLLSLPFPLSYPHNHDPTVPIKEGLRNVQDVIEKRQMGESTRRETAKTVQELLQKLQALKKLIDSKNVDQLASVRSAHPPPPPAHRHASLSFYLVNVHQRLTSLPRGYTCII